MEIVSPATPSSAQRTFSQMTSPSLAFLSSLYRPDRPYTIIVDLVLIVLISSTSSSSAAAGVASARDLSGSACARNFCMAARTPGSPPAQSVSPLAPPQAIQCFFAS